MPRLFVSYARPERDLVEALIADLRRAGYDAFFDEQLTGGQGWWDQLLTRIEQCDAFIPALSHTYVNSLPCRREGDYAHGLGKPILPIMLEDMNPAECADYIADAHCVSYVQGDSSAAIDLMRALMNLPPSPALPEPMPERPEIPVTYVAAAIRSAKDRVESIADLTRADQVVLLSDLKMLLSGSHSSTAFDLLREFAARTDLTVQVAKEIDALLPRDSPPPAPAADVAPRAPQAPVSLPPVADPEPVARAPEPKPAPAPSPLPKAQDRPPAPPDARTEPAKAVTGTDPATGVPGAPGVRTGERTRRFLGRRAAIAAGLGNAGLIGTLCFAPWFYDFRSGPNRDASAITAPSMYHGDYHNVPALLTLGVAVLALIVIGARLRRHRTAGRGALGVLVRIAPPVLGILALVGVAVAIAAVREPPHTRIGHVLAVVFAVGALVAACIAAFGPRARKVEQVDIEPNSGWL